MLAVKLSYYTDLNIITNSFSRTYSPLALTKSLLGMAALVQYRGYVYSQVN
jgi:hypothetical protein